MKTELSLTYAQRVRTDQPYNFWHGTIEARPLTATTTKLLYTLLYDESMVADDATREKDKAPKDRDVYASTAEYEDSCRGSYAATPADSQRRALSGYFLRGLCRGHRELARVQTIREI